MISTGTEHAKMVMDFKGFDKLRAGARDNDPEALKAVSKQFEGLFLQMIMKSMRSANKAIADNNFLKSDAVSLYEDMFDQQLAMNLSNDGGIGLAKVLVQQMSPSDLNKNKAATIKPLESNLVQNAEGKKEQPPIFENPVDFVKSLWDDAVAVAKKMNLDPKILIAQAALETGWGKHIIKSKNGDSSFNLFNIKANKSWANDKVAVNTLEYENGIAVKKMEPFRAYKSFEESFSDYFKLLQNLPRYDNALSNTHDAKAYIHELQNAGYATDPNYAKKVYSIYKGDQLNDALKTMEAN